MTIQQVQAQMGDNLKRWYPGNYKWEVERLCIDKLAEEFSEWENAGEEDVAEEAADIVIALAGYCSQAGIDLQSEIERKLAIVSARTDQAERDRARGIG